MRLVPALYNFAGFQQFLLVMTLSLRIFRASILRHQFRRSCVVSIRTPSTITYRTMATEQSSNAASTAHDDTAETEQKNGQPLSLPEPPSDSKAIELDVSSGNAVKLDHLGPMVVNRDGTLSRIGNWEQMTEIERRNTLRILGKRNQLRLESLKAAGDAKPAAE